MTDRQMALYKLLLEVQDISVGTLFVALNSYYHRLEETSSKANSSAFRRLRADVEAINMSNSQYAILPIIINGRLFGYKLADSNDAILEKADKYHNQALKLLKKESELRRKVKNDNQYRFTSEVEIKPISSKVGKEYEYGRAQNVREDHSAK